MLTATRLGGERTRKVLRAILPTGLQMKRQIAYVETSVPVNLRANDGRVLSLDGLRAISILLVLFGHFLLPQSIRGIGAFGVTTFFFISGFLITRLLFNETKLHGSIDILRFYLRRLLRLYPVIVVSIAVCVVYAFFRGQRIDLVEIEAVFFYFTNYLVFDRELAHEPLFLPIGPFWSLAVEEHFYLAFPAIFVAAKGRATHVARIAIATCIICLALRCAYLLIWPSLVGTLATYWRSETRFDSIAFGVLLAALCELPGCRGFMKRLLGPKVALASVAALLASFAFREPFYQDTFRFTIQGLALLPIVGYLVFSEKPPLIHWLLNCPFAVWIGQLSYSLYVWHGAVIFLFSAFAYAYVGPRAYDVFLLVTSFAVATLSYYMIEMPFMNLRRRLRR